MDVKLCTTLGIRGFQVFVYHWIIFSTVYTNCRGTISTKERESKEFCTNGSEIFVSLALALIRVRYFCASMHHRLSNLFAMRRTKVQIKTRPYDLPRIPIFPSFPFFLHSSRIDNESSKKFTELKSKIMHM